MRELDGGGSTYSRLGVRHTPKDFLKEVISQLRPKDGFELPIQTEGSHAVTGRRESLACLRTWKKFCVMCEVVTNEAREASMGQIGGRILEAVGRNLNFILGCTEPGKDFM